MGNFNANAFRTSGPNSLPLLAVNLHYNSGTPSVLADGIIAAFDAGFSRIVGEEDASKMVSTAEGIAIANGVELLSIDARPIPQDRDTLFLNVSKLTKPEYTLQIFAQQLDGNNLKAYLEDAYLQTSQPLSLVDTNKIIFNVNTADAASSNVNRFRIVLKQLSTLPVTFTSITATPKDKNAQIDWTVAEQNGIQKYQVERSVDGLTFTRMAEVAAKANNTTASYQWLDVNTVTGSNYYRVRAIQADNKYFFSKVVVVKMDETKLAIKIFPNPIKSQQINLQFNSLEKGQYSFLLLNASGQQILKQVLDHRGGSSNQSITFSKKLPAGTYYLQVINAKVSYSERVLIQ